MIQIAFLVPAFVLSQVYLPVIRVNRRSPCEVETMQYMPKYKSFRFIIVRIFSLTQLLLLYFV